VLAKQDLFHLRQASSPFCSGYFCDGGLVNYFSELASNCNPPNLKLPSSEDYRNKPPLTLIFKKVYHGKIFYPVLLSCIFTAGILNNS
jgi:hypothetical protein